MFKGWTRLKNKGQDQVVALAPEDIELFSRCPRRYYYECHKPEPRPSRDSDTELLRPLFLQAYSHRNQGKEISWGSFSSWVDKRVYRACANLEDPAEFLKVKDEALRLRAKINKWFHGQFLTDKRQFWVGLEFQAGTGIDNVAIRARTDIVALDNDGGVSIIDIGVPSRVSKEGVSGSLCLKVKAWVVASHLGRLPSSLETVYFGNDCPRSVEHIESRITKHDSRALLGTLDKSIKYIALGIYNGVNYPSVSAQCTTCSFNSICSF